MNLPIFTNADECKDCYKCIRECPVKAIKVENSKTSIMKENCILCAKCVQLCKNGAKTYKNDVARVLDLLNSGKKVIASLDPTFIGELTNYSVNQFISILKQLGFYQISETAIGADFLSSQINLEIQNSCDNLIISSDCPVCVSYIHKYFPEYKKYISNLCSPMLAHARFLKQYYGEEIQVVYIGPCVAKKIEAEFNNEVFAVLTFEEIKQMIIENKIEENFYESDESFEFVPFNSASGSNFSYQGGIIDSLNLYNQKSDCTKISVSGIKNIANALKKLKPENLTQKFFLEVHSCNGGCVNGRVVLNKTSTLEKLAKIKEFSLSRKKTFDDELKYLPDCKKNIPEMTSQQEIFYKDEQIKQALESIGKFTSKDYLNCNGCGYSTCKNFAIGLITGRTEKEMCLSYIRTLALQKANSLIHAIPSGVVIVNKDLKILECNENFAKLYGSNLVDEYKKNGLKNSDLTQIVKNHNLFSILLSSEDTEFIDREVHEDNKIFHFRIFYIENKNIIAAVIEDITAPGIRKNRIITQAQKVIDKNLEVVQKIAFLLGENAAETEAMLNSIIESYGN